MGNIKQQAAIVVLLFIVVALMSCHTATQNQPIPTTICSTLPGETTGIQEEEFPYRIPGFAEIGLSFDQYQKIDALLYGVAWIDEPFDNPNRLTRMQLLTFVYHTISMNYDDVYLNQEFDSIAKEQVDEIIHSAFHNDFTLVNGDTSDEFSQGDEGSTQIPSLQYKDGKVMQGDYGYAGDPLPFISPYKITRNTTNDIVIHFNLFDANTETAIFRKKGYAVIVEDRDSLFGYYIASFSYVWERPVFTRATASAYMPLSQKTNYKPEHVLDGDTATQWAVENGENEWIMISSDQMQTVTGVSFNAGEWNETEIGLWVKGYPSEIVCELSDGTVLKKRLDPNFNCIEFGREIQTNYIKITVLSVYSDLNQEGGPVYINEIAPF